MLPSFFAWASCWQAPPPQHTRASDTGGSPAVALVAYTSPPEVYYSEAVTDLPLETVADFVRKESNRTPTKFSVPIRTLPPNLTPAAQGGRGVPIGGRVAGYIIDGSVIDGYRIYLDVDGTGDLSQTVGLPMHKSGAVWDVEIDTTGRTSDGQTTQVRLKLQFNGRRLITYAGNLRRGVVTVDGNRYPFAVVGVSGYYGLPPSLLFFDTDGDGRLNISSSGAEWVFYRQRQILVKGRAYRFTVDSNGYRVSFESSVVRNQRRAELGRPAPLTVLPDIDGNRLAIPAKRRSYLLVDFCSLSCPPCVEDVPRVREIQAANADRLRVVGITPDAKGRELTKFVEDHNVSWSIASVDLEHEVYSLYGVSKFPTYALIGPDGKVACLDCSLGEIGKLLRP